MKKIFTYCTLIFSIMFNACTVDDIDSFGDQEYINFDIDDNYGALIDENGYVKQDYSFAFEIDQSLNEKVFSLPVMIAGIPKTYDRTFSVQINDTLSTAEEGVHFELFADADNVILAGEETGLFRIKVKKTDDMDTTSYKLAFSIVDNNVIKSGWKSNVVLTISNGMEEPEWWPSFPSIGYFTKTKGRLWMAFHGVMDGTDPWLVEPYVEWGYDWQQNWVATPSRSARTTSVRLFVIWLEQGDKDGNPYYDENGDLVLDTIE